MLQTEIHLQVFPVYFKMNPDAEEFVPSKAWGNLRTSGSHKKSSKSTLIEDLGNSPSPTSNSNRSPTQDTLQHQSIRITIATEKIAAFKKSVQDKLQEFRFEHGDASSNTGIETRQFHGNDKSDDFESCKSSSSGLYNIPSERNRSVSSRKASTSSSHSAKEHIDEDSDAKAIKDSRNTSDSEVLSNSVLEAIIQDHSFGHQYAHWSSRAYSNPIHISPLESRLATRLTNFTKERERQNALKQLRELYDQGTPFWTKNLFQAWHDAIQSTVLDLPPKDTDREGDVWFTINNLAKEPIEFCAEKCNEVKTGVKSAITLRYFSYAAMRGRIAMGLHQHTWNSQLALMPIIPWHSHVDGTKGDGKEQTPVDLRVLTMQLKDAKMVWDQHLFRQKLINFLDAVAPPNLKVTKLVGISTGMCSYARYAQWARSVKQHAVLDGLRDIFEQINGEKVRVLLQDPAYDALEKTVLGKLGMEIVNDPDGFLETDENTLIMAINSYVPVKEILADYTKPAVIIWISNGIADYQ
jgi:hypothetical protein